MAQVIEGSNPSLSAIFGAPNRGRADSRHKSRRIVLRQPEAGSDRAAMIPAPC